MAYGFFFESRIKRQITGLFGQYVPPELVNEMAKDPTNYSMEGESRDLTILFSDVRGFTTISESLKPKDLAQLMNGFLSPFSQVIYEQRGTIDKYMGDCIMAFWGAPVTDPDHARHGVQAAFAMLKALEKINADFKSKGWPEINIGVGLNSGKVSVGNMGSKIRLAYTVMGDAVNLASRLEGITKEYGAKIVIGQATKDQIPDLVCRELDRVRVKGKDVAVTIFEPIGFDSEVNEKTQSLIESFHKALGLYRAQQWDSAQQAFAHLLQEDAASATLYRLYLARIESLRVNPPPAGWDGAFTFTTK
jgi:adenylate cyclase